MIILACKYRTEEGECMLENKTCDGCKDLPHFIDWEDFEDKYDDREENMQEGGEI